MTTRRTLLSAAVPVALAGSLAACGSDGSAKVRVAVLGPGSLQWLHAIAKDQGFFADHDVEVEDVQVQNSSALVQAVASGSADAGIALGDNVINAVDEGADITIVGTLLQKAALRLYGAPGIEEIADLEGTEVTAGAVEGGTYELLVYMLQEAGVDPESLTPVAIANSSDRVVAMENGQVQGALLIPPFDTVAEEAGATMLGWYDQHWLETPLIVNREWASENTGAATGLTQGLADAARYFADGANEDESVRVLQDYSGVEEGPARAAYEFIHTNEIFSPDLSTNEEGLLNIARIGSEVSGTDASGFDPAAYIDDSYLGGSA
ncbi:ABC transporter substrate-binding protein [Glycomyces xiaoerkulensis]|uniref:ABC transporter substrate-binding protein n=1 Tax=Glycomyces xiaoerkulensis TaxID=2038139 RepID=UPI000C26150E|nr:ABC transporter substrate-binding protein [Glycomyces xiaoerkulensis]